MDLYELDVKFAPEPPHDKPGYEAKDVAVVYVDKTMLRGNQNRLVEYVGSGSKRPFMVRNRFAEPTIRALVVLLDLASKPWLCHPSYKDPSEKRKKRARRGGGGGGDDDDEEEDEDAKKVMIGSWTYVAHSTGESDRIMNRIEVYVETIMDADQVGVRGWSFMFFVNDTELELDVGIGFHAAKNCKITKRAPEFWEWVKSPAHWVKMAVSPYSGMRFTTEDEDFDDDQRERAREAFARPLRDERNPARVDKNFTFEASRDGWDDAFYSAQADADSYFESGYFTNFPIGARWIPPQLLNVRAILFGELERPAHLADGLALSREERLMAMSSAADTGGGGTQEEDVDEIAKSVANSIRALVKTHDDRLRTECAIRFQSWLGSNDAPPGIRACWDYIQTRYRGKPVVPERDWVAVDESLSTFGNAVSLEMLALEHVFNAASVHSEVLFDMINAIGAFRYKHTLRLHILCLGPPASGKSFRLDHLLRISVGEVAQMVGHQSKHADDTNTNRDCTIRLMDEANDTVSDKGGDGSGLAGMKIILSNGQSSTEYCEVDTELKTRETKRAKSHMLVQLNANSNATLAAFPDAIRSRLLIRYIPERARPDLIDASLRDFAQQVDNELLERELERRRLKQALGGIVSNAIDMGWLPEVDLSYAVTMLDDLFERLKRVGVKPDPRSKQRIPLYLRALTIWYATYVVFETHAHFDKGTPFRLEHIVECARYLRCSRELVYFGVTHMYDTLVNVNLPEVCKAIKTIVSKQERGAHPKRAHSDKRAGDFDVEYYHYRMPLMAIREGDLLDIAAGQIAEEISRGGKVVFSKHMVLDTLYWMKVQITTETKEPMMKFIKSTTDDVGFLFRVDVVDSDHVNHVVKAVIDSVDDWVRGTDARFVLGITFRNGVEASDGVKSPTTGASIKSDRICPHLFRVLSAKDLPKTNTPFMMRNPHFREYGHNTLFADEPECDGVTQEPYVVYNQDVDAMQCAERLEKMGLGLTVEPKRAHGSLGAHYPDSLVETHLSRFDKQRCTVYGADGVPQAGWEGKEEEESKIGWGTDEDYAEHMFGI